MIKLENLQPNAAVRGVLPDALVTVVSVQWFGSEAIELTYKTALEDVEDLEDAPDEEIDAAEEEILDQATAARSIAELRIEIATLKRLASLARAVQTDTKWRELASLLEEIFTPSALATRLHDPVAPYGSGAIAPPVRSPRQKLVIFTEHRDTLSYLERKIGTMLGDEAVVTIHGGIGREDRLKVQESFRHDPEVRVLLATDAAGEGINLQRAHLPAAGAILDRQECAWIGRDLEARAQGYAVAHVVPEHLSDVRGPRLGLLPTTSSSRSSRSWTTKPIVSNHYLRRPFSESRILE